VKEVEWIIGVGAVDELLANAELSPHDLLPASGEREQYEPAAPSAAHSGAFFNGSLVPAATP
jgi:hypothetical protein